MDIPVAGTIFDTQFLDAATYHAMNSWVQPGAIMTAPSGLRLTADGSYQSAATFYSTPWQETGRHPTRGTIEPVDEIWAGLRVPPPPGEGTPREHRLRIRRWDVALRAVLQLGSYASEVVPSLSATNSSGAFIVPLEFISAGPLELSPGGDSEFTGWRRQSFVLGFLDYSFGLDVSVFWTAP